MRDTGGSPDVNHLLYIRLYYVCFNMLISNLRVLFLPECKIQHFKAFLYVEDVGLGLDMLD